MRRAWLLAIIAVLTAAPPARANDPPAIVRPQQESRLPAAELGRQLFAGNCARCHGSRGRGTTDGPPLNGAGALAADFYLRSGYMPLGDPDDQPERGDPRFSDREIKALVSYVDSLGGGPAIPQPDPAAGSVAEGRRLFTEHCAGCHQVVAEGGVVTGARVPPLDRATPTQIAEAVRIGPYVMPKFSMRDIDDSELDSIIAYVRYAQDPDDAGGWGIDHLGPFPEGMVAGAVGAIVLVAVCMMLGERARRRPT